MWLVSKLVLNRKFSASKSPTFHILTVGIHWLKALKNNRKMIKRNLASFLIIISSIINILNIDFSNISESKHYWSLIISSFIILASVILIFSTESKFKKNRESE